MLPRGRPAASHGPRSVQPHPRSHRGATAPRLRRRARASPTQKAARSQARRRPAMGPSVRRWARDPSYSVGLGRGDRGGVIVFLLSRRRQRRDAVGASPCGVAPAGRRGVGGPAVLDRPRVADGARGRWLRGHRRLCGRRTAVEHVGIPQLACRSAATRTRARCVRRSVVCRRRVPLAWFGMALPAREVAHAVLGHGRRAGRRIVLGAAALTAWDLFLDPQMVGEGYWTWTRAWSTTVGSRLELRWLVRSPGSA